MTDQHEEETGLDPDLAARLGALPRELEPERDLWPGIEGRLASPLTGPEKEAKVVPLWSALSMAGVGLAAAAAFALWWAPADSADTSADRAAIAEVEPAHPEAEAETEVEPGPATGDGALLPGEDDYRAAAAELTQAIEDRRDQLPGELATVYEENVGVVDQAIDRSRAALAADPEDEQLQALLDDAYRRKLDLLEQVAAIPGRT